LVGADNLLDCFIVRDVSKSPNSSRYDTFQREILSYLRTKKGDRISYAQFAGDTFPRDIQPPSQNLKAIDEAIKGLSKREASSKTDFALLFNRLRDTIARDRNANVAVNREPHSDVVIILSDGVPDAQGRNWNCPSEVEEAGEKFIPQDVRDAYESLVSSKYATNEPLLVYLILAGEKAGCSPRILQEWQVALGPLGLHVVPYAELPNDPNLGPILFSSVDRQACIYLMPAAKSLRDEERMKFDRGETFSIQYSAFSRLSQGSVKARYAKLIDHSGKEVATLFALNDPLASTSDPQSRVRITVDGPSDEDEIRGPAETATAFFRFDAQDFKNAIISPKEIYTLRLIPEPLAIGEIGYDVLLDTSSSAKRKEVLEARLTWMIIVSGVLVLIYLICLFGFHFWGGALTERLQERIHKIIVAPVRLWVMAGIVLLVVFAVGWTVMGRSLVAAGFLVPAMLLWGLLKIRQRSLPSHEPSLLLEGCILAGEFLLLPAAAAIAAEILVKTP
jgi:hypothetical protein